MSIMNLMLLGFLMEKPMNPYEIKKEVENRNLSWWIKGSAPSIYRNVNTLAGKGYIDGKAVREGEMPEKTVYTINDKGRLYFKSLMEQYSAAPPQIYLDFTAVIANISKVDQAEGKQSLKALHASFTCSKGILESIEKQFDPYQAKSVIQLSRKMYDLLCQWLRQFYEEYYGTDFDESGE